MATRKLFYEDPYLRAFTARIISQNTTPAGVEVVLDQTAFFPTGGGQPCDLGTLNEIPVLDVLSRNDQVVHLLPEPLPDGAVIGRLDWERRFDFMQQHAGQHILSQVFKTLYDGETVSFHLTPDNLTVDIALPALSPEDLARAEDMANEIIWANLPILARFVSEEELSLLSLRKPLKVTENIRIVSIGNFDHSPCGGTHPKHSSEIGMLKIRRTEKIRGITRVEFLCGFRALRDYRQKNEMINFLASSLSVKDDELPAWIAKTQETLKKLQKAKAALWEEILEYKAQDWREQGRIVNGWRVVAHTFKDMDLSLVKLAAAKTVAGEKTVALFALENGDEGTIIFSRSADGDLPMGQWVKELTAVFGGRGGGSTVSAQAGGFPAGRLPEVLAWAERKIAEE